MERNKQSIIEYIKKAKRVMEVTPKLKETFKDLIPICLFCREEMKEFIYSYKLQGELLTFHLIECPKCQNHIFIYKKKGES